ncbi:MAG: ATP-dependent metallopeptidase FtsH/Yme1/Tma family protein [Actinomycetota bacterium]
MRSLLMIISQPIFWASAIFLVGGAFLALILSKRKAEAPGAARRVGPMAPPMTPTMSSYRPEPATVTTSETSVTFADVAGLDEVVNELREVKDYLADPERFRALGAELPRGILLYGPPGSGKTLLAKALAGEAGVPFYSASASSFVEVYVGMGAARVRQLFEEAKRHTPCLVFIDELDAVGRRRTSGNEVSGGEREFDVTLNQLLIELDGFATTSGVLILGATNRPELIDPALLRPGRFDRSIHVDRPDLAGRESILELHASKRPFSTRIGWRHLAGRTAGLTGAELAHIINEAAFLAARRHRPRITEEEVEEAVDRVLAGPRSNRSINEEEKRLIAYHEAGHALLSLLLKGVTPASRVSIVGRIGGLGRSAWGGADDREVLTRRELMAQLMVLLGGRAAEKNAFGEPSTRAEDDLEQAADLARRMVMRWAMTERFELSRRHDERGPSARSESDADREVRQLLEKTEQAAIIILQENPGRLKAIAEALMEQETLTRSEIAHLAGIPDPIGEQEQPLAPVRMLPLG